MAFMEAKSYIFVTKMQIAEKGSNQGENWV
jgi:hypothetical protein